MRTTIFDIPNIERSAPRMNEQNMSRNLQYTRRRLKLSQKQFVENFLSDENGEAMLSVPKLSNLENKGGNNLDRVCYLVADRLGMQLQDFTAAPPVFSSRLEESLSDSDISNDKDLEDIVQEADTSSELVEFLHILSNHLTDQLIAGSLHPGDKIPSERELSRRFNVSRSIAREALKVLNVVGMIDIIPGKGTFIASGSSDFFITPISWAVYLTDRNTGDVFFVRTALEESIIESACQRATDEDLDLLRSILEKTEDALESEDYDMFADLDMEFHLSIASCSHNEVARSLLIVLRKLSTSISHKGMVSREQMEQIYKEHTALYKAIRASNVSLARRLLMDHFKQTKKRYHDNTDQKET